jgi:hypothetical protein
MKEFLKKVSRTQFALNLQGWCIARYMQLVYYTTQWTFGREEILKPYWDNNKPIIACFWHGRMGQMAFAWKGSSAFNMLISQHIGSRIISYAIERLGTKTIYGSSSRGKHGAIRSIITVLKRGESVGITPDGPRGPLHSVQDGIIQIACLAQVDIIPMTFSTSRRIKLKTWDELLISLPFSKGVMLAGEPLKASDIKTKDDIQNAVEILRERMIKIGHEADDFCDGKIETFK